VLDRQFRLSDAQELVALQSGFESWPALRAGVQAMTGHTSATIPASVLGGTEAQLFVTDLTAAREFYVARLGFTLAFSYGEPAFYAQVRRDSAVLNLRRVDEPVFAGDIREREHLLSASVSLASSSGLRQLFLEYRTAGVDFHQPLRQEPWGARTFIVRDIDGNLLLFAGPAA
jgi:catechol 2,3-dioxygenase-like lactoylglutathione lyase family enzyme